MTGLRGGGPLTTLVMPSAEASLWQVIWANVPCGRAVADADLSRVFPWLAPTIISGKGGTEVRVDHNAHPLQCWWGMPRRIRLDFENRADGTCDLTGRADGVVVTGWRQRPYGPKYAGWIGQPYAADGLIHPLTPRYRQKEGTEWLAVHPQPGGIGYRHWTGVVVESTDANRLPASCVTTWRNARARAAGFTEHPRLLAAGFDMDNMKARGFVESAMPLPGAHDEDRQHELDDFARQCVGAATQVADLLRGSVREALFGKGSVSVDATLIANVRERFWLETETPFFALLREAAVAGSDLLVLKKAWLKTLQQAALREFDAMVVLEPDMDVKEAQRSALARMGLLGAVSGTNTAGKKIMQVLDLPVPVATKQKKAGEVS